MPNRLFADSPPSLRHRAAPTRLERGLREQQARLDAERRRRSLRFGQQRGHELGRRRRGATPSAPAPPSAARLDGKPCGNSAGAGVAAGASAAGATGASRPRRARRRRARRTPRPRAPRAAARASCRSRNRRCAPSRARPGDPSARGIAPSRSPSKSAVAQVRAARALEHHADEQRLELHGHVGERGRVVALRAPPKVARAPRGRRHSSVSARWPCTCVSARSRSAARAERPLRASASRIATRSPGAAPTWFTASTMSFKLVPGSNTNMRSSPFIDVDVRLTDDDGVGRAPNAFGWLTSAVSVMRTTSEPCATAAGVTRTFAPMTTVPVRELTMTLAAASAGSTSRFSMCDDVRDALRFAGRRTHAHRDRHRSTRPCRRRATR